MDTFSWLSSERVSALISLDRWPGSTAALVWVLLGGPLGERREGKGLGVTWMIRTEPGGECRGAKAGENPPPILCGQRADTMLPIDYCLEVIREQALGFTKNFLLC